ncbi:MAG: hypothetical protein V1679_00810 [Candidatus Peregrinibacteria bacterium]
MSTLDYVGIGICVLVILIDGLAWVSFSKKVKKEKEHCGYRVSKIPIISTLATIAVVVGIIGLIATGKLKPTPKPALSQPPVTQTK